MLNLSKRTKTKPKPKPTLIFRSCSYVCAYRCAQLLFTMQHRTVPIISPLILQRIITAPMMSSGREGKIDSSTSSWIPHHHHNRFTALFPGPPGWACARRELLDFMVQGEINKGRHTDHPTGRHFIQTNQRPPPPSTIFYVIMDSVFWWLPWHQHMEMHLTA